MKKNEKPEVVIVGSIGLDTIETPFGKAENVLGGSASYAAIAASFFAKPGIASIIGKDFPEKNLEFFKSKGIGTEGIEKSALNTFHWEGKYGFDVNVAETLKTELNALEELRPKLPESYRNSVFLFLGNFDPEKQLDVFKQMKKRPKLVVSDTMNYYISTKPEKVLEVVKA
ncbi:MAG: sugar kinase, partial [Candidatus ainarchaeum sp.]|nr:sugar kinase [Candidatus ainarchaeum sp.]